ncbi:hypothetical protein BJL95_01585 [Methylomonas sp. LWB]|nr:hypothetical protein BJL95_01585 [Methylomonas sp. LWB]
MASAFLDLQTRSTGNHNARSNCIFICARRSEDGNKLDSKNRSNRRLWAYHQAWNRTNKRLCPLRQFAK